MRLIVASIMSCLSLAALASACCLQVTNGIPGAQPSDAGPCGPCAAFYTCDVTDGQCKCGASACSSGNCDDNTQICQPGCGGNPACGAGSTGTALAFFGDGCPTNSKATILPDAVVGQPYLFKITAVCGTPPYRFANGQPAPPYLTLASNGDLTGTVLKSSPDPILIFVGVSDAQGKFAYQNFIIHEVDAAGQ